MNKKGLLLWGFPAAYACFFSLGLACALQLLGIFLGAAIDGRRVLAQYPRLLPFCLGMGLLAAIALAVLLFLQKKAFAGQGLAKRALCLQLILAALLSVPALWLWEVLFELLQKSF